jgi:hypothetical protein
VNLRYAAPAPPAGGYRYLRFPRVSKISSPQMTPMAADRIIRVAGAKS